MFQCVCGLKSENISGNERETVPQPCGHDWVV
jgi:hypothetical protein